MVSTPIDPVEATKLLEPGGALSKAINGFEVREAQLKMLDNVIDAYNKDEIALIEAGTGTGKSMAYLIPALLWAAQNKERTVISTHTINLQEQLVTKDIPQLIKALNLDLKAVLVKGMGNYLCLRKLQDAMEEVNLRPEREAKELQMIEAWAAETEDGSRSKMSFVPSYECWDQVGAESDACNHNDCPHRKKCFFFNARQQVTDAQILVVNHHLLFADLAARAESNSYGDPAVLPPYSRIIIDEAHHIEDIATEFFASRTARTSLLRVLGRLASDQANKSPGRLIALKKRLNDVFAKEKTEKVTSIDTRLAVDLPAKRRTLLAEMNDTFDACTTFIEEVSRSKNGPVEGRGDNKLRLLPEHFSHPYWKQTLFPLADQLKSSLQDYAVSLESLEKDLVALDHDRLNDATKGIRTDIQSYRLRLTEAASTIKNFLSEEETSDRVRWLEAQQMKLFVNAHMVNAELEVGPKLANFLFEPFATVVLCSATLTTNRNFSFIRKRLGLTEEFVKEQVITENSYESPFNYQSQAMLIVPRDLPAPQHPSFLEHATEHIWQAILASQGNAFVLFTSYGMLRRCHEQLKSRLTQHRYPVFCQGEESRQTLLQRFRDTNYSVLFGTDSFWEGVDVVGDALRCVILVKLPFQVPSEPIIQARTEAILARGGEPFFEYSVPNAKTRSFLGCPYFFLWACLDCCPLLMA